MDECANDILHNVGHYDVVTHAATCFLQIFFWNRFEDIAPRPMDFEVVTTGKTVVWVMRKLKKSHSYISRAWR